MASLTTKRQQVRNEKALQELMHNIPGNNFCADCSARNPAWASWSLGIFLCMRCAAIHRKLGTHISKVKSLSMDSWTTDQVDAMKKTGNMESNKIYNPTNKKPPVPIDADEADSAMERFIRAKYTQKPKPDFKKNDAGVSDSDEGPPPPLPPKTGGFFSLKSKGTSSTFPLSFRSSKKDARSFDEPSSPRDLNLPNKPSKVFGTNVGGQGSAEDMAQKLTQLRDMGFADDKRNAMVLKGVNGNLEKAIESLVRLGERGNGRLTPSLTSPRESSLPASRSLTPQPPSSQSATFGASQPSPTASRSPATPSNNPWEITPAQPQSSQSTGTSHSTNPFYSMTSNANTAQNAATNSNNTNNPFGLPGQPTDSNLNQSMQNLSLGAPQPQALFPHHTGGLPAPQPMSQPLYQQSMTPPISQQQHFNSNAFYNNNNQNQMYSSSMQQQAGQNPFLQNTAPQQPLSVNTAASQLQPQPTAGGNPFLRSPTRIASPTLNQIPEQTQQNIYSSPLSPYGNSPFGNGTNPFQAQVNQSSSPMHPNQQQSPFAQQQPPPAFPYQQQQQQLQLQQQQQQQLPFSQQQQQSPFAYQQQQQPPQNPQGFTQQQQYPRFDKSNIMALYGQQSYAQSPVQSQDQQSPSGVQQQSAVPAAAPAQHQVQATPQRSMTAPIPQTASQNNPFMGGGYSRPAPPPPPTHIIANPGGSSSRSRESMTLGMEMAWNNGRHSPDAFASLSARSGA